MEILFNNLLEECLLDVIFQEHRKAKLSSQVCQVCSTRCRTYVLSESKDIFGNDITSQSDPEKIECPKCSRQLLYPRFASHLEKCLNLVTGRQAGRNAARRLVNSNSTASSSEKSNPASSPYSGSFDDLDDDGDLPIDKKDGDWAGEKERKRKRSNKVSTSKPKKSRTLSISAPSNDTSTAPTTISTLGSIIVQPSPTRPENLSKPSVSRANSNMTGSGGMSLKVPPTSLSNRNNNDTDFIDVVGDHN
ncbi:hypothetical protein BKA69DRAFT_1077547 [Paraphysoderma sedebokerense]|nr:hypothetical protein BKA69DRAFT_1077547 [Paraphysoderma sedebokerense]